METFLTNEITDGPYLPDLLCDIVCVARVMRTNLWGIASTLVSSFLGSKMSMINMIAWRYESGLIPLFQALIPCSFALTENIHPWLFSTDLFVDEATARGRSPQRSAKDGVAVEGPGAGPSSAQVPLCQRSAVLLRANGRRQRWLCPAACMTQLSSEMESKHSQSLLLKKKLHVTEPMERASKFEWGLMTGKKTLEKAQFWKTCSSFLSAKKEMRFYWGGKENIQLALSSSKFLLFCLSGARGAESFFALRLWYKGKNSSVQEKWGEGTEIYFRISFLVPALLDSPPPGRGIRESSPENVVPILWEDWGDASPVDPGLPLGQDN